MEAIVSPHAPQPVGPYSQAVRTGDFLFLAGQIPLDPATGKLVDGDIKMQACRVLENIKAVLLAAGTDLRHVVKSTVFMVDLKEFPDMNAVYAEYFKAPYPARSTVQVAALPTGARVEIEVVVGLK
jgi:2-iminobutanoate/2-iminopropanoate deaminase